MDLLLKNVLVDDPQSKYDGIEVDILVKDGRIDEISTVEINGTAKIVDLKGTSVSPGWLDIGVQAGEPGLEHREDYHSLAMAAAVGGFTGVACYPNVLPIMDNKSSISYLKKNSKDLGVDFYPIGAVSVGAKGGDITELMDMHHHGAVAFSDGSSSIQHSGLMTRALLYCRSFDGLIINQPNDFSLSKNGHLNEGVVSSSLGLKGMPALAEELMLQRDIALLAYTGGRLHIGDVSSIRGVDMIRIAKQKGLEITASVAAINLLLEDNSVDGVDTNLKVFPPLRTKEDRLALQKGLLDGTIDCINSNHVPLEEEAKKLEFPYAEFGAVGLETAFSVACTAMQKAADKVRWSEWLSIRPREILGLPLASIREGASANMTFYDPHRTWKVMPNDIFSKSKNSPFIGHELKGRVLGILLADNLILRK